MLKEQIKSIIDKDLPLISNLSNVSAVLNTIPNLNWCGFYLVKDDYLYLGPFQGEVACTIIPIGKGVCGTAFEMKKAIRVPDVSKFIGHIACSSKSKSELVVPILKNEKVVGVIDLDSPILNRFDDELEKEIIEISQILSDLF